MYVTRLTERIEMSADDDVPHGRAGGVHVGVAAAAPPPPRRRCALLYSLANNKWFTMKYAVVLATDVDVKSVQIVVFAT